MEKKIFYRVGHKDTKQGLWYQQDGSFTGKIHNELSFCKNNALVMDFDDTIVGWLSATETIDELFAWFPIEDLIKLQDSGFYIIQYETEDYDFYIRHNHWVINQSTSVVKKIISVNSLLTIA